MTRYIDAIGAFSLVALAASALAACAMSPSAGSTVPAADAMAENRVVEGYWRHEELISSKGQNMPLEGVFLFHDGTFIQQAVMGDPADPKAEAMAHSGPYTPSAIGVDLVAQQTISISGSGDKPLSFTPDTRHNLTVTRDGDKLKLVFGSGTVQTFTRIAGGPSTIYNFGNGRLGLIGDRFVLVAGDGSNVVSGYGTYRRSGETLSLDAERWAGATAQKADIRGNTQVTARFDGRMLTLPDGRAFTVVDTISP